MAGSTVLTKIACLLFLGMVVFAPPTQAMTCGVVVQSLMPCLGYLKNGGDVPQACCNGVKSLNSAAKTTPDRQQACVCIKLAAKSYGINYGYGSALPGKCGVDLGIEISPSLDCSRVH